MNQQELEQKFKIFEQQIMQIQQQLEAIEKAILDVSSINTGLEDLKGKTDKEIMAPIGRGIYAKAKLISENLLVDVGEGNFVTKNIDETKIMIKEQMEKLQEMRKMLESEMDRINKELTDTMRSFEEKNPNGIAPQGENH
ncbi:MAG: prefoldin subunit alpha [Nanoarchaeota archaeon]|nr:prefoldin subunit alpha [Nanoarchaeota archaeon]